MNGKLHATYARVQLLALLEVLMMIMMRLLPDELLPRATNHIVSNAFKVCRMYAGLYLTSGSCSGRKALSDVTWLNSSCCVLVLHWILCRWRLLCAGNRADACERCRSSDMICCCNH
jgi:hypothetical protein